MLEYKKNNKLSNWFFWLVSHQIIMQLNQKNSEITLPFFYKLKRATNPKENLVFFFFFTKTKEVTTYNYQNKTHTERKNKCVVIKFWLEVS